MVLRGLSSSFQRCSLASFTALGLLLGSSHAQTTTLSVTLTAAGPLGTFNPPPDCTTFSPYSTQTLVFGDGNTRSFTMTSLRQGCYAGGPATTCCPPDYQLGQFHSPGVCPGGYTTMNDIEFVAVQEEARGFWITYAPIGTRTAKLCCPRVAESIKYTADGPVPLCFASTKGPTVTGGGIVTNHETIYFASAIIVIPPGASDAPLPSVTTKESNPVSETGSPGQTSSTANTTADPISQSTGDDGGPGSTSGPQDPMSQPPSSGGLSGGAIAGIAIGVAVPIILVGLYLAYRFGKRKSEAPSAPKFNEGGVTALSYKGNGAEPGIPIPSEIGGIQSSK